MIDHVLGRPSVKFRKYQVFAVVVFWTLYLNKGNKHGPPVLRRIFRFFSSRFTTWQTFILTLLYLYVAKNFGKLVGLESPEPLANLYTRPYFRATWVTTALDAGFWTAMHLKPKWFKDIASVVFTVYYLVCAEQADEKVRQVRGGLTLDHLRVSWNKPRSPLIRLFNDLQRPKRVRHRYPPREIRIPRPSNSAYKHPVHAWLYFDGPLSALCNHDKIILDVPGGGFVAMDPRCHDDKLFAWSGRSGLPLLALNYQKAPEHPYPYALNECYDVYHMLVATRGQCIGFSGEFTPKIVVSADSAGANLAVAMVLMVLQSGTTDNRRWHGEVAIPPPEGLVLVYPALDMNIGNWMTDEQMALIKDRRMRKTNRGVLRRKSDDYRKLDPDTPQASEDEDDLPASPTAKTEYSQYSKVDPVRKGTSALSRGQASTPMAHTVDNAAALVDAKPSTYKTRLAMSSMLSYFNDRILTPEMMRAMIVLYIGPHSRPDFSTNFYLSPLLAPEATLARFPKTYMLTGERDPLVDDTVIFAGRLRQAKLGVWRERKELGLVRESERFDETKHVNVMLVPGISHGFLQFVSVFPEGWKHIFRARRWMIELFREAEQREAAEQEVEDAAADSDITETPFSPEYRKSFAVGPREHRKDYFDNASFPKTRVTSDGVRRHHTRARTGSSGDEDRPLEMSSIASAVSSSKRDNKTPSPDHTTNGSSTRQTDDTDSRRSGSLRGDKRKRPPTALRPVPATSSPRGGSNASQNARQGSNELDTPAMTPGLNGPGGTAGPSRSTSFVSLNSADDLLGRRMKGLTGALMGEAKSLMTP